MFIVFVYTVNVKHVIYYTMNITVMNSLLFHFDHEMSASI